VSALGGLLDILYPPACVACARVLPGPGAYFCGDCAREVEDNTSSACARCAEPGDYDDGPCVRCRRRPPPFTRAFAPFIHEGPVARAIHQLKYEDHPELVQPLGELLAGRARDFLDSAPRTLCAIPLHRKRLHQRKYDQAQLLVEQLGRLTGRWVAAEALERVRFTERQVGLDEAERELNVAGAFQASAAAEGQRFVLVDDVLTTGATARSAARALLEAGAAEVQVLTLARAFTA
jgi:ComF family protein